MTLFETNAAALRMAVASFLGCEAAAFEGERLTIVDRAEPAVWPYVALAATFGVGTVLSVDPELRAFADTLQPERHYDAVRPAVLTRIAEEARRLGRQASVAAPGIGWALASIPDAPDAPRGLELMPVDADWMAREMEERRFENGIGLPGEGGRSFRNRYGLALFDPAGEPVAVAGVFFTYADPVREIGVDVVREHRGQGLGRVVVAAAIREILERGEVPFYSCAATNIRSQRTALSAGFLPAFSDASVS
ncbi:MAG TPA: GNAT family N-acetyltransferase [Tepidiformaceae bacterium]|nr:GNAT family N-acetyltransferase [Tepidiformaceae bacterium]